MLRPFRKPMVIMSPKSLLRHKMAVSSELEFLGDNHFMHAPRTGAEVRVESMDSSYWVQRYNGARRILDGN